MKRIAVALALALCLLPGSALALSASQLVSLTNADRAGMTALREDPYLDSMARWRATDMLQRNYASHLIPATTDPEGHSLPDAYVWDYLRADGYCWTAAGENALMEFRPLSDSDVEALFMASPEHRANIRGLYERIGVGYATGADNELVVDVIFTTPCASAGVTLPPTDAVATTCDSGGTTFVLFYLCALGGMIVGLALWAFWTRDR
jgi:uncharacterized protein YkwD